MPNMEAVISRSSKKLADGPAIEICSSKFDLDYAYGKLQLSKRAMDQCIFAVTGGSFTGNYRFLKGSYGLADIPTIFQENFFQRNRSNRTYSARLTRWLDRLAHFSINVNRITGKNLALMDYPTRNLSAPPEADDAYDEEYVINSMQLNYKFKTKYGCLSNHLDQSQSEILRNEPKQSNTREQTAIACLNQPTKSCTNSQFTKVNLNKDARTIDKLELVDPSAVTRNLIASGEI